MRGVSMRSACRAACCRQTRQTKHQQLLQTTMHAPCSCYLPAPPRCCAVRRSSPSCPSQRSAARRGAATGQGEAISTGHIPTICAASDHAGVEALLPCEPGASVCSPSLHRAACKGAGAACSNTSAAHRSPPTTLTLYCGYLRARRRAT